MWTCPKCGEALEDQFDSCWKCAAPLKAPAKSTATEVRRWRNYYGVGFAFELLLILLVLCLPRDSWLWVKTLNFFQYSHFLLLAVGERIDSGFLAMAFVVFSAALMGLLWAALFFWMIELGHRAGVRFGFSCRSKKIVGYSALTLCGVVAIGMVIDSARNRPRSFETSPEVNRVVNGNTAFALDFYQQIKEQPGNLFFSPFSISTALAITYAGARGVTESEIAAAGHFSLGQDKLPPSCQRLMARMDQIQRWNRINLVTANGLWLWRNHQFNPRFYELVRDSYDAQTRSVDFEHDAPGVSENINAWIARKTKGLIPTIVQPSQLTPDTALVLCNAIYFKGKWASQFKASETKPESFSVSSNRTVTVPMMRQKADFRMAWIEDPRLDLIELPYYGRDLSMIVILPESIDGLPEIENVLTTQKLTAWLSALAQAEPRETIVSLPRFSINQNFDLIPALKALGMRSAFDPDTANLSGIDGTAGLVLSAAAHKTFVEVNESGTEAAAVTMIHLASRSMSNRFTANHPFIYLIRDNGSGAILFLGRLIDPAPSLTLTEK